MKITLCMRLFLSCDEPKSRYFVQYKVGAKLDAIMWHHFEDKVVCFETSVNMRMFLLTEGGESSVYSRLAWPVK